MKIKLKFRIKEINQYFEINKMYNKSIQTKRNIHINLF